MIVIYVALLTDCLKKLYVSDLKHTVVERSKMQLKTVHFFKEFFARQSSSLKLCTNKKFLKCDERKCISLDCEHKVAFLETHPYLSMNENKKKPNTS